MRLSIDNSHSERLHEGSRLIFRTHQEIRGLANDDSDDPPSVRVQGGHGLLLHEAGPDPGPGPELSPLAHPQGGGERGLGEEMGLQEVVNLLKHGGGDGTNDGILCVSHFHCI